jgi:hypothetical protein
MTFFCVGAFLNFQFQKQYEMSKLPLKVKNLYLMSRVFFSFPLKLGKGQFGLLINIKKLNKSWWFVQHTP